MGEIRLVAEGLPDLLPMLHRSPGVHVSHVINDICIRLKHYTPDDPEESDDGGGRLTRMGLGSAWEWALIQRYERHWPGRYVVLGELERDGLYGTPDLFDTEETAVHEMKATWMSTARGANDVKFWKYWRQLQAYCAMLGVTKGVLHVVYVNGNYKFGTPGSLPRYRVWECEWSKEEIERSWASLVRHAVDELGHNVELVKTATRDYDFATP